MKFKFFFAVVVAALCSVLPFTESRAEVPAAGIVRVNVANKAALPVSITLQCYYYSHIAGQEGGKTITKEATIQPGSSEKLSCCSRSPDKNNSRRLFEQCDPKKLDGKIITFPPMTMNTYSFPTDMSVLTWNVDVVSSGGIGGYFQLRSKE